MADPQLRADTDRALVEAAVAGAPDAFDELIARYQVRIYNLVLSMTRNSADADDLAQDTFVRAYRALPKFRGDSLFRTWLYQIAVNVVRSHLDRERRQRWSWLPWAPGEDADPQPIEERLAAPDDLELGVVRRDAIDRALSTLPDDMRAAVVLRDVHGLEYREIADVLAIPLGTVESRIYRARQRLKPLLAPLLSRAGRTDERARQVVGR
jgi:RNA polymerase sigma-70 factor (ECF subfamily)